MSSAGTTDEAYHRENRVDAVTSAAMFFVAVMLPTLLGAIDSGPGRHPQALPIGLPFAAMGMIFVLRVTTRFMRHMSERNDDDD